jgi:hypothetical protein
MTGTHAKPETPTDDQVRLNELLECIDDLCRELSAAQEPMDAVSEGAERVIKGESPAKVASELRALSHAKDLRIAITKDAIDRLAFEAADVDAQVRVRDVPSMFSNQLRIWIGTTPTAGSFVAVLDDVHARQAQRRSGGDDRARAVGDRGPAVKRKPGAGPSGGWVFVFVFIPLRGAMRTYADPCGL